MRKQIILFAAFVLSVGGSWLPVNARPGDDDVLKLAEEIFQQIPRDLSEIDPQLGRIAVYRLETDNKFISASLQEHIKSRLLEIMSQLDQPRVVSLPKLNTLQISSTDTTFSILNSLPTPEDVWRVGKKLRVDAFLEGNLTYIPKKALLVDLRLNRIGTNEVLWAKSYSAYEKNLKLPKINPLRKSINAGLEIFNVDVTVPTDSLISSDFSNRLIQYSAYVGVYQYVTPKSRLRYELRLGLSYLSEGIQLNNASFGKNSFYYDSGSTFQFGRPSSFNIRSLLTSAIAENKQNPAGDWLSVYLSITRYFAVNMPDITGFGIGFRSDINAHFSVSAGIAVVVGKEFSSGRILPTNERARIKVSGLHYDIQFLQFTF